MNFHAHLILRESFQCMHTRSFPSLVADNTSSPRFVLLLHFLYYDHPPTHTTQPAQVPVHASASLKDLVELRRAYQLHHSAIICKRLHHARSQHVSIAMNKKLRVPVGV